MVKITIGDTTYTIPELSFAALERAWPYVDEAMMGSSVNPLAGPIAALRVISASLMTDENFQPDRYNVTATPDDPDAIHEEMVTFFRTKLKARQMASLKACMEEMMVEAGLVAPPGEEMPAVLREVLTPNPSTETAQDLLQS